MFGSVERDVGLADEFTDRGFAAGAEGDADTGSDGDLVVIEAEGLGGHVDESLRQLEHVLLALGVFADHDELVAAETGDAVTEAECLAQAVSDVGQETVASVVAEAVIDELEAVEVEEQDRDGSAVAGGS